MRLFSFVAVLFLASGALAGEPKWTLDVNLNGKHIEGLPLIWSQDHILMARDGRVWNFKPDEVRDVRQTSSTFQSLSAAEVRARLAGELGKTFEISGTGHYLVAHAPGQRDYWSQRFEDLYRSFVHYFRVRGFRLQEPEFPLVAIVFRNQDDFLAYARRDGAQIGSNVLGYYSPVSNRISLFDIGGGRAKAEDWHENAATIIHEAAHQTAFNTGVHRRFGSAPRWLVEGLGTMFEAEGVWDSTHRGARASRYNRGRLAQFKRLLASRPASSLEDLITSDRVFQSNVDRAYAEAWAFSFFLVETRPKKYSELLARTAARPVFSRYDAGERLGDFTALFGKNLRHLEAEYLQFLADQQ
ncbi:MAG TPA: DUF1570 domain-containing protein [Pirellulales bacterium]|jgi:hypothetical protein|nr:DUF1570 domain-containing protein [Pirellulales bacterium]